MKHLYFARDERCSLEPLDETDTELLRRWRNRADLSRFLQPLPPISQEEQKAWYARYLEDADTLFFAIKDGETGKTIGTVALYHLMQNCCEIGKIVIGDDAARGRGMGTRAVFLALGIAFCKLGMTRVRLNVHLENIAALTIYVRVGRNWKCTWTENALKHVTRALETFILTRQCRERGKACEQTR